MTIRTMIERAAALGLIAVMGVGCGQDDDAAPVAAQPAAPVVAEAAAPPVESASQPEAPATQAPAPQEAIEMASAHLDRAPSVPDETDGIGPRIEFAKRVHDFGPIWEVDKQDTSFEFTNTGDSVLVISDVKASCGCTATALDKKEFLPGESYAIDVRFSPKGSGRQSKRITVVSNSVEESVIQLAINAEVRSFTTVDPQYLRFGEVEFGVPHSERFTITSQAPDFEIVDVKTAGRAGRTLSARVVDDEPGVDVADGTAYVVEVTLEEDAPWGSYYGTVSVDYKGTLDDRVVDHTARVNVNAMLFGELRSSEDMLRLSMIPPGSTIDRSIKITRVSGEPFEIIEATLVTPSMEGLRVTAEPLAPGDENGYAIALRGDVGDHLGPVSGYIRMKTDVPGEENIEIRFAGVVRDRAK